MEASLRIFAVLFLAVGCSAAESHCSDLPYAFMHDGDLAFRCGRGVFSRMVTAAEERGVYSHVGVLVRHGGEWMVVHSVPGEKEFKGDFARVREESVESFYAPDRAYSGCLVHTGLCDSLKLNELCSAAIRHVRDSVRFDNAYDLDDTTLLYCSEMVWRLYLRAGLDLSEGRRRKVKVAGIHADCILPEHLLDYSGNDIYFSF